MWILANCLVEQVRIVLSTIMWPFAGVPEVSLEIPSRVAEGSLKMKFAELVELTQTVKLDLMTLPFVDANKTILETLSKVVEENVNRVEIVHLHKNVFNSNAWQLAEKELVEKMPTALPGTTELNVPVLQTS